MNTKHAQDLNLNDIFQHNELKPWKVIQQPVLTSGVTIKVVAEYTGSSKKKKTFNFGRMVTVDIVE